MPGVRPRPPARGPHPVVVGVGASRGCPVEELSALVDVTLRDVGAAREHVAVVASVDLKADEPAILDLAAALGVPTRFAPAARLANVPVPTPSAVVAAHVGTPSVAEAAALLVAGPGARLLATKRRSAHATCAVAAAAADRPSTSSPAPEPIEVPSP